MDGYLHEDRDELMRHIQAMMAQQTFPPEVVGYDVEFGNHFAFGDPAVWIRLHVPSNVAADFDTGRRLANLMSDTTGKLKQIVPHRLASTLLRRPPSERTGILRADT